MDAPLLWLFFILSGAGGKSVLSSNAAHMHIIIVESTVVEQTRSTLELNLCFLTAYYVTV
jgi:hypothetical protein